jgi:hypothetical protein
LRGFFVALPALFLVGAGGPARALVINNGLAPPNPANVIDADNSFPGTEPVRVQDEGCNWDVDPNCAGGGSTTVALVDGGVVGGAFTVHESSTILMSGGSVGGDVAAYGSATIAISGGSVAGSLSLQLGDAHGTVEGGTIAGRVFTAIVADVIVTGGTVLGGMSANDSSHITIRGGTVMGPLEPRDDAGERFLIVGTGFAVDGQPVPYGPIAALQGTLTGNLESGDPIAVPFAHACYETSTCFITLAEAIPEPSIALLVAGGLVSVAAARRASV